MTGPARRATGLAGVAANEGVRHVGGVGPAGIDDSGVAPGSVVGGGVGPHAGRGSDDMIAGAAEGQAQTEQQSFHGASLHEMPAATRISACGRLVIVERPVTWSRSSRSQRMTEAEIHGSNAPRLQPNRAPPSTPGSKSDWL